MNNLLSLSNSAIADIVALALILIFSLVGLKKGFAQTFISAFGTIISLTLASLLCSKTVMLLQDKFNLIDTVSNNLAGTLSNIFGDEIMNTTLAQATETNLNEAGIAGWLVNIIMSMQVNLSVPTDTTLNQIICPTFAYYIVLVIAFLILFVIFKILLWLLGKLILKLHSFKAVKIVDCSLGFALGLIKGILFVELFILIIGVIPIGLFQSLNIEIQNAPICSFLSNINLYALILNSITNSNSVTNIISNLIK